MGRLRPLGPLVEGENLPAHEKCSPRDAWSPFEPGLGISQRAEFFVPNTVTYGDLRKKRSGSRVRIPLGSPAQ